MVTQTPRGTKDIYGKEVYVWQWLEQTLRDICHRYCATEIRTPTFEHTELFVKNIGDTTDIVNKEMYTFEDKGGRSITLKPEGTAGAARAYIEHSMYADTQPVKMYYITNAFRYETPQAGRYREFNQFGIEIMGSYAPASDAEVISMGYEILKAVGVTDIKVKLNSLGEKQSRARYHEALKAFIKDNYNKLCPMCKDRYERNPLRVLDCKEEGCKKIVQGAPTGLDYLVEEDRKHFQDVQDLLQAMGVPFEVDPLIVRGLDYYTRTVFEYFGTDIGAQSTLGGGGRYDPLIENTGGPKTGACGFAMGMERLLLAAEHNMDVALMQPDKDIFIGYIGDEGFIKSQALVYELRKAGISAEGDALSRSVKKQLKYADKLGVRYSLILGDDEIKSGNAKIKNMVTGEQEDIELLNLVSYISGRQGL